MLEPITYRLGVNVGISQLQRPGIATDNALSLFTLHRYISRGASRFLQINRTTKTHPTSTSVHRNSTISNTQLVVIELGPIPLKRNNDDGRTNNKTGRKLPRSSPLLLLLILAPGCCQEHTHTHTHTSIRGAIIHTPAAPIATINTSPNSSLSTTT